MGWRLLAHRKKWWGVEVDLVMGHSVLGLVLIEVKSLSRWEFIEARVTHSQRRRLKVAAAAVMTTYRKPAEIWLAVVDKKQEVKIFCDFE